MDKTGNVHLLPQVWVFGIYGSIYMALVAGLSLVRQEYRTEGRGEVQRESELRSKQESINQTNNYHFPLGRWLVACS